MTDHARVPSPPKDLLRRLGRAAPAAETVVAEIRSQATLPFDPKDAPGYLAIQTQGFGSLLVVRADVSVADAEKIRAWLAGAPPQGVPGANREEALKDLFEQLETGAPPESFVEYIGTYVAGDFAVGRFTMLLGFRRPVGREAYRQALADKLNGLQAAGPAGWHDEVVDFLRLIAGQASSTEEFLMLASALEDLKDPSKHPVISRLIP